jgi:hypothetical protein
MTTPNNCTSSFEVWNFIEIWDLGFGILGFGASLELLTSEVLLTKEVGSWSLVLPATAAL